MNYMKKLENKIRKEKEEVENIDSRIAELKIQRREVLSRVAAFEEAREFMPDSSDQMENKGHPLKGIRKGSFADKARTILLQNNRPLKIIQILNEMGEPKSRRQTIGGILSNYVRRGEIFSRPEPGVFGLLEFESEEEDNIDDLSKRLKAI